jgi:hypothetical protein
VSKAIRKQLTLDIAQNVFSNGTIRFCSDGDFRIHKPEYEDSGLVTKTLRSHKPHPAVDYRLNTSGVIGQDFIQGAKILTMGCSVTAGIGVGDEFAWPNLVRTKTGLTLNSVAFPGASIPQIASSFFEFIATYGCPEYLFILVPEITRQWVYIDGQPYRQRLSWDDEAGCFWSHDGDGFLDKNKKGQHLLLKACIQNSLSSMIQISNACKVMGIKFAFYSWDESDNEVYELAKIDGYLDKPKEPFDSTKYEMNEKTQYFWNIGVDKRHAGALVHIKYSERFLNFLNSAS